MVSTHPHQFYYLENFQRVLDWIAQRYSDLLSVEEQGFISRFPTLPLCSRALLVRMVMRKGEVFRYQKLHYNEIGCPDAAAKSVVDLGWLKHNPSLNIDQLFGLLRKAEVLEAFHITASGKLKRKTELLEDLRHEFSDAKPLNEWVAGSEESIYEVTITSLCECLRLMFFGNIYQDWSEFVLSDLGIYRYEKVEFSRSTRGFRSRQDIDDYLHLHRCRERFDDSHCLNEVLRDIPGQPYENLWLEGRRNKLLYRVAQQYERCGDLQSAFDLYRKCNYHGARLRTIRVLEKRDEVSAAFALSEVALNAPESESEHQALLRILHRLRRKLGLAKVIPIKSSLIEAQNLTLAYPTTVASVERVVQSHLSSEQNPVFYIENALINSLFGLLCWPAIFAPILGAFFHPFHRGPADLLSPDFVQKRQEIFGLCLAHLDSNDYQQAIVQTYHAKFGIQSPFVFWGAMDEALLMLALHCIPATHLKKYFERILQDIPANRSGLPDLIQFWPEEKRYLMLEVKGPGDRLQDNQIRWINYCIKHEMPVAVTYVQWLEQAA